MTTSEWNYRIDPVAGLTLSSIGLGTYLGAADNATDTEVYNAAVIAVKRAWNVLDTAATYRDGRAEQTLGRAFDSLFRPSSKGGRASRDELFVSTKAGFLNTALKAALAADDDAEAHDIVGDSHCMHPRCLELSLRRSLDQLHLQTVDLLYLHNVAEAQLREVGATEFRRRLRMAFEYLEEARAAGLLRFYGLATWDCFRVAPEDPGYLALADVHALAVEVGGRDHGLRYVQLPVNLGMPEAWSFANQPVPGAPAPVPLVEAAAALRMGVFGSAPFMEGRLVDAQGLQQALDETAYLEVVVGYGGKLLQMSRSVPGVLAALVGHKTPEHMRQNMLVSAVEPLEGQDFRRAVEDLSSWLSAR